MFLGLVVLIALLGAYFFYHAISKDFTSEESETSLNSPISPLPEKNSNTRVISNSNVNNSTSSKGNNSGGQANITKNTKNQGVVDQTLKRNTTTNESVKVEKRSVVAKQEHFCLTIKIYDLEADKAVANYDVIVKYKLNFDSFKTEKLKSDGLGNCQVFVNESGPINFQIFTKDYGIHSAYLVLHRGINEYKANLIKGGSLEIHAVNPENKVVENLTLKIINGSTFLPKDAFVFDASKGTYLLTNMPLGLANISFKAPGYQETSEFLIRVDSKETAILEIILQPAKLIYFSLNISVKPDLIRVYKSDRIVKKESDPEGDEQIESFKNKDNLYEYSLDNLRINQLWVCVNGYLPQMVLLSSEVDTYPLTLKEASSGEIHVFNEKNMPIQGAKITYGLSAKSMAADKLQQQAETNKDGIAILSELNEKMFLRLNVAHKDYVNISEDWPFDAKTQNTKKIILKDGNGITGKVKNKGIGIMGAKVTLYQEGNEKPILSLESDFDGSFYFNNFSSNNSSAYYIKAFHRDYGRAHSGQIQFDNKKQIIELSLEPEKSITVCLLDNNGVPIANKIITLIYNLNPSESVSAPTDEKGCLDFYNLTYGSYAIKLDDDNFTIKNKDIQVPGARVDLVLIPKNLKKIMVTTPGGGAFKGILQIKNSALKPIELIKKNDGFYYVEFPNDPGSFILEAQGYPVITLGSYEQLKGINDLVFELKEGQSFKVRVVDIRDLRPIKNVSLNIYSNNVKVQSMPTNESGEVNFTHLSGKINISLKVESFALYKEEIDLSQAKEVIIKLVKGGHLKGHLTFGKDVKGGYVFLQPNFDHSFPINPDGSFLIRDMIPGDYSLSFKENFKDGKNVLTKVPEKIKIESDKTFEINLDEYLAK